MKLVSICEIYGRLEADCKIFKQLKFLPKKVAFRSMLESLQVHNKTNLSVIREIIISGFPEDCSDFEGWSANDIDLWLAFLLEHPDFWADRKQGLVLLFDRWEHSRYPKPKDRSVIVKFLLTEQMLRFFVSGDVYLQQCMENLILTYADEDGRNTFDREITLLRRNH